MGFVDKLFECLSTKNYLGLPAAKEPPKEEVKPAAVKSDIVEVIQKNIIHCSVKVSDSKPSLSTTVPLCVGKSS